MGRPSRDLKTRIESKLKLNEITGCLEFTGFLNNDGYGHIRDGNGKGVLVHRAIAGIYIRKLKPKEIVRHKCNNRKCANHKHLQIGTQAENLADMGRRIFSNKLTEEDVIAIRKKYIPGKTVIAALARQYNVTHAAMSYVVNNKTWKHLL